MKLLFCTPCKDAKNWLAQQPDAETAWNSCSNPNWMLWILYKNTAYAAAAAAAAYDDAAAAAYAAAYAYDDAAAAIRRKVPYSRLMQVTSFHKFPWWKT